MQVGTHYFAIKAADDVSNWSVVSNTADADVSQCGDMDASDRTDIGDVVYMINYIFAGGLVPIDLHCGDVNGDGKTNIGDAVYLINFMFAGGPEPCIPRF